MGDWFFSASTLAISALLNGIVNEIKRKQRSYYLFEEERALGKELFIPPEPLKPIKEDENRVVGVDVHH